MIALTYDDGPSEWTPKILDLLAKHEAHATFFVVGDAIPGRVRFLRRMIDEGHEIGNHTMSHPHLTDEGDVTVQRELDMTTELIYAATGAIPHVWRAPYLDIDERVEMLAARLGLTHVGCDLDTGDWRDSFHMIMCRLVHARGVVLMHDGMPPDGGSGTTTRDATVSATEKLLEQSGEFVTVSDLQLVA